MYELVKASGVGDTISILSSIALKQFNLHILRNWFIFGPEIQVEQICYLRINGHSYSSDFKYSIRDLNKVIKLPNCGDPSHSCLKLLS